MRKFSYILLFTVILLCVIAQYRGISHAGPTGTAGSLHDMSYEYFGAGGTQSQFRFETDQVCFFLAINAA